MKVEVTLKIELELNDEVSVEDNGLHNMVEDDIIGNLHSIDMDFQTDDDRDVEVKSVSGYQVDTQQVG